MILISIIDLTYDILYKGTKLHIAGPKLHIVVPKYTFMVPKYNPVLYFYINLKLFKYKGRKRPIFFVVDP